VARAQATGVATCEPNLEPTDDTDLPAAPRYGRTTDMNRRYVAGTAITAAVPLDSKLRPRTPIRSNADD